METLGPLRLAPRGFADLGTDSRRTCRTTSRTSREHPYASLFAMHVYVWRGSEKGAIWGGVDVASANLQNSNHRRLARAPRRGLRGQSSQVLPNTNASRAVRRSPVSRLFPSPGRSVSVSVSVPASAPVPAPASATVSGLHVAKRKRDVLVVFDPWFAGGAVKQHSCGIDPRVDPTELLLAQPDRRGASYARELLSAEGLGRKDRACTRTGSDFADDDQRASASDDVQLQAADPHITTADFKTALLEHRGNQRFTAARELGFTGLRAAGRGRSSFLGARRRPFQAPLRR